MSRKPTHKDLLAFADRIARIALDGEKRDRDGEEYEMENDDAWSTVYALVGDARLLIGDPLTVHTWADGHGVWHAKVRILGGLDAAGRAKNMHKIRAKAGAAIRREIAARQGEQKFTVRLRIVDQFTNGNDELHSITYAEDTDR